MNNPWGIEPEDEGEDEESEPDNPRGVEPEDEPEEPEQEPEPDDPRGIEPEAESEEQEEARAQPDNPWGIEPEKHSNQEQPKAKAELDNPWGIEPESNANPEPQKDESKRSRGARRRQEREKEQSATSDHKEVNVDDIFASLHQLQQQQQQQEEVGGARNAKDPAPRHDPPVEPPTPAEGQQQQSQGFDPTNAFEREGLAKERISPRDFRLAAASNDYESLVNYLEIVPEHINRQDRHGWTALHLAVTNRHERIVRLLLNQKHPDSVDPGVLSYQDGNQQTALDLALEAYGMGHPITEAFFDSGWYSRAEYVAKFETDEERAERERAEAEEARRIEQRRSENQSRLEKEERIARAEEKEMRAKQEKMRRLFGAAGGGVGDDDDDDEVEQRRNRLDALLGEL